MPFSLAGSSAPGQVKSIRVQAVHRKLDGSGNVAFEMKDESEGTRRLIQYAGGWLKVLQDGAVLFFDELDVSLHPAITRFLISLFNNPEQNLDGAQLVFSTHDTNLLDKDLFRRDQIWFTEKDKKEETRLYPLLDFSPRQDDNLEKGYLRGRYGALPFVGSILFDGQ
jgi:AAA15 family ATPase/GTPase